MNQTSKRFFGGLESLRGVAAVMVVLYHLGWDNPLSRLQVVRNSYLMVDLFFVLSGFVIFHSYHAKLRTRRDVGEFMFLRLGRIYPLHLVFLFVFLGIETVKYVGESRFGFVPYLSHAFSLNNAPAFTANLLLVHPFFPFANKTFNSPSWSIGVEFYVYLLFAVAATVVRKRAWLLIACGLFVCLAAALLGWLSEPGLTADVGYSFLRCVLGFFAGVCAYQIYDRYQERILVWSAKLEIVLLFVLGVFLSQKENPRWDYGVIPLFVLLVIVVATSGGGGVVSNALNSPPLRWLGKVSYSIYMVHLTIMLFLTRVVALAQRKWLPDEHDGAANSVLGLGFAFLAVALVLVTSEFTYKWIELAGQNKFRKFAVRWFGHR